MSTPRTPTKSAGSKQDESKSSRGSVSQAGTPPIGSAQPRSLVGSPAVRSNVTSSASATGNRDKLNSATNKPNAASPIPSKHIYLKMHFYLLFLSDQIGYRTNRNCRKCSM
jgi:hypothetical protein